MAGLEFIEFFKRILIEQGETSLIKSAHTIENILNMLPYKEMSKCTVETLTKLNNKLSVYLDTGINLGIMAKTNYVMIPSKETSINIPNIGSAEIEIQPTSSSLVLLDTPDEESSENVNYVCGLCNKKITIFNSDHDLSVSLHVQEEHQAKLPKGKEMLKSQQQAISTLQEINKIQKSHQQRMPAKVENKETHKPTIKKKITRNQILKSLFKKNNKILFRCRFCRPTYVVGNEKAAERHCATEAHMNALKYKIRGMFRTGQEIVLPSIDTIRSTIYSCKLCNLNIYSMKNIMEHVSAHETLGLPEIIAHDKMYFCICCNQILGPKISKMIRHKESICHKKQMSISPIKFIDENNF